MESTKIQDILLQNTPFIHPCNVYKETKIPILKDFNVSDECKEIGKHLLDMTKTPLSQHIDVLIPSARDEYTASEVEHFKTFFGKKYTNTKLSNTTQQQQRHYQHQQLNIPHTMTTTQNACLFNTPASHTIKEFIETERSYVKSLEQLVHNIMKPIRESITNPNKTNILDQYSFNRIFLNAEDILSVNRALLNSLQEYQQGTTTQTFGQILRHHFDSFDCYKIFFLGKTQSLACHNQNVKQNKNYSKFIVKKKEENSDNYGLTDLLILPVQRLPRYTMLMNQITEAMSANDADRIQLEMAKAKVSNINDMQYGDSSLLNLYHLIRDAPASLIQTRQLLGYYDATELSLQSGKSSRPVTILIFTDKIMVVKRKNYSLQGKDYLEKIEEKVKDTLSSSMLQKAKEAYNGLPLEFKGWADIRAVQVFHGLKDRPDTFFLRTHLPEQSPNATERECEAYFRRSDRLYSMVPNTSRVNLTACVEKKKELISLCQQHFALSKTKDSELYYEDQFKIPAYTHFYDEKTYTKAEHKNNILVIYLDSMVAPTLNLSTLLQDVWVVAFVTRHEGGYKLTIRARTNLIPIREKSRDIEYENIVGSSHNKMGKAPLDFIDTLWNNIFFYERRLRATEAFSSTHDGLLRTRARSRSRSKSLTRVASNMSLGRIFSRSRSSSPTRPSQYDEDDAILNRESSHVPDPIFKVATVNKGMEGEFRGVQNKETSEIFVRDDTRFIDGFNEPEYRPHPYARRTSVQSYNNFDVMLFSQSPDTMFRPPSGGSSSASSETSPVDPMPYVPRSGFGDNASYTSSSYHPYSSISSYSSSIRSYLEDNSRDPRERYGSTRSSNSFSSDERLMSAIDSSRRSSAGHQRSKAPPLPKSFYSQSNVPTTSTSSPFPTQPGLPPRAYTSPDAISTNFAQLKLDVNDLIDDLIHSQHQMKVQGDSNHYYNNTYESVRGLRTHIVSRIDEFMNDLGPKENDGQYDLR